MAKHRDQFTIHFRAVRWSLATLDRAIRGLSGALDGYSGTAAPKSAAPRRKLTLTPARHAALKLQGQYMGHVRGLKPRQKAVVKAVKVKKGILVAIGVARSMGR